VGAEGLKREADNLGKQVILVTQDEYGINMAEKAGLEVKTSPEEFEHVAENAENQKLSANRQSVQPDLHVAAEPVEKKSGLVQVRNILDIIPGIEFIYLTSKDVVRHSLVQKIVDAYKIFEENGRADAKT